MTNTTPGPASKAPPGTGLDPARIAWGERPSPWLIGYACAINGFATGLPGRAFTYCELGCPGSSDLLFMAAANPHGRFFGINTDGASLAAVRSLQAQAGVDNCSFRECPAADLGTLVLPPVDFLVLTGVLAPDEPAAHRALLAFVARHLTPGGMVLCAYRTPHAWAFWEPVLHFLRAAAALPGDRAANIQHGLAELGRLREAGAALFEISPLMGTIVDSIGAFDPPAFDRAFLQTPGRTLHFDVVCREMAGLGLQHAGGLPLGTNYPQICLPAKLQARFAALPGPGLRESWKDLVRMPFFRQDLFTAAPWAERPELPAETVLGSHLPRAQFQFAFDLPGAAAVRLDGPLFPLLADLLAENALSLGAILAAPGLKAFPPAEITASLAWMTAMEQIRPFAAAPGDAGAGSAVRLSRFNAAVLQRQLADGQADVALASWTLGNGLALNPREALSLLALSEAGPENAEAWAGRWLVNHTLPGEGAPNAPSLGQSIHHIMQQAQANPRSLAVLGLSEQEGR
jgi:SAM-dependent methyltransferase